MIKFFHFQLPNISSMFTAILGAASGLFGALIGLYGSYHLQRKNQECKAKEKREEKIHNAIINLRYIIAKLKAHQKQQYEYNILYLYHFNIYINGYVKDKDAVYNNATYFQKTSHGFEEKTLDGDPIFEKQIYQLSYLYEKVIELLHEEGINI